MEILATPTFWSTKQCVHTRTRYAYRKYLRDGPGFVFFFFYISTIINKENNKLVLKNVCLFSHQGLVLPNSLMAASMSISSLVFLRASKQ